MKVVALSGVSKIRLNSFRPLCLNEFGKRAIETHHHPPFIDASCRREPDFENPFPSISALCRQGQFAPHLKLNEIIVYITVKGKYFSYDEKHHRLVAILQVTEIYKNHPDGQRGYSKLNAPLPSNCMVNGNPPYKLEHTAGKFKTKGALKKFMSKPQQLQDVVGQRILDSWNDTYLQKSITWPCFIRTMPIYVNTQNPVPIFRLDLENIFNKVPNTRNPNIISRKQLIMMGKLCGLKIRFK
jgi:hypothetical protein